MRTLVGFDGSDGARDAVALTRLFCTAAGDGTLLVNVLPYGGPLPVAYHLLECEQSEEALRVFDDAREQLSGVEVEARSYTGGSPALVLSDLAEEERIDLVVVGSPRRGAIGRALIGSVAEALLHGATIPTVVAPHGYAKTDHSGFDIIGVAYSGTPESKLALDYAQDLAARSNAGIRILTVAEPLAVTPGVVGYTPPPSIDSEELMAGAIDGIDAKLQTEGQRLIGPTATSLANACENGVDLLIVGSRGYGPAGRVLLGSVSTQLIHKAPCPVLVVPRGKTSDVAPPRTAVELTEVEAR